MAQGGTCSLTPPIAYQIHTEAIFQEAGGSSYSGVIASFKAPRFRNRSRSNLMDNVCRI